MADVLAIYSICSTALRTAQPLPQHSPVLFSRYLSNAGFLFQDYGRRDNDDDDDDEDDDDEGGLPKRLTVDVLESQEYLSFAVGVITLSGIVMLLDRLILATKQLVGESFELPPDLFAGHHHHRDDRSKKQERRERSGGGRSRDEKQGDEATPAQEAAVTDEKRPPSSPRGDEAA